MSDTENTDVMTAAQEPQEAIVEDDFEALDGFGEEAGLPGRPRRVLVNRYSAGLLVVLVGAACFYGGVRVEKADVGSGSGASASTGLAARFGSSGRSARGGSTGGGFTGGGFTGAPAGLAGASAGTSGTISSIDGDTLYVSESSGTTVKVKLSDLTKLTKTVSVSRRSLYPGDSVTVTGTTGSGGTVSATALSDSGSSTSTGASSASASGSSGSSSSSGLSSLFGG